MILCLEDIHKSFATGFWMRQRHVLRGVSLELGAGDAYGLLGANGAGKSTTLRILLGLSTPDRGRGTLFDAPLGDRVARMRLGYAPETPAFHEQLTAREFLRLCGGLQGLRGADLRRRADAQLEALDLASAADLRLRKMSKGMLQRLGLAQALLGEPELLVLDEPMSGLDPLGRKLVRDLILEQRAAGRTVLFSTHILSDVEVVCTRAGMLSDGVIAHELRLDDLAALGATSVEIQASGLAEDVVRRLASMSRSVTRSGRAALFVVEPGRTASAVVDAIHAAGGTLDAVIPRRPSLEEVLLRAGARPDKPVVGPVAAAPKAIEPAGVR
jgi:ABC-2 type transport system ATP-binding protein